MSEGRKSLLIVLVFFVVVGGTFGILSFIKNSKIKKLEVEIKTQSDTIALIQEKLSGREDVLNQSFTEAMFKQVPPVNAFPQIINRFYTYANERQVTVNTLSFNKGEGEDGSSPLSLTKIGETIKSTISKEKAETENKEDADLLIRAVEFTVELQGDYENLRRFVLDLQQSERLLLITDWKLASGNPSAFPTLSLTVNSFYAPALVGVADVPADIETYIAPKKTNPIAPRQEGASDPFGGLGGSNSVGQDPIDVIKDLLKKSQ